MPIEVTIKFTNTTRGTGELTTTDREEAMDAIRWTREIEPDHTCVVCGKTDTENEEDGYGPLVDFRIIVAESEEGWADETRFFCDEHMSTIVGVLRQIGYRSHRHGGINYLEDTDCPGCVDMDACPTPETDE